MTLTFRQQRQYPVLPPAPPKGPMPPQVSVIIPIARTNLVTNPSIEIDTTGYTASGGVVSRTALHQYHGTYSLAVSPGAGTTGGAYYAIALTAGNDYAFSCKFLGWPGLPYKVSVANTTPTDLAVYQFIGTGRWQWVWVYFTPTSSTTYRFYFTKNGSTSVSVFWIDGVQVEQINVNTDGETLSTYIDGDQPGLLIGQQPPAYLWNGTPHASTSQRSALTRAGGYLVNLQDAYNFLLTGIIGLGMAAPNNVSIPYTVLDGARYLRTTKPPRTFSLPGRFQADDDFTLKQGQSAMRAAFDRDLIPVQQPLVLQVQPLDDCGADSGDFAQIQCIYAGGLEGNDSSTPQEDAAPAFTMYLPYLIGGSGGAALSNQGSVTLNQIAHRDSQGNWDNVSNGVNSQVNTIAQTTDGSVYAGGVFTLANGVANTAAIAKWNGSAWSALGSGLNDVVYQIAPDASGNLYVGGAFLNAGGIGAADCIAKWNGSAWSALSTGANNTVTAVLVAPNGDVYIGGLFTLAGGVANTVRIAKWNGSAWSALSTGMNGTVFALAWGPDGNLYAGGAFTTAGGATVNYVAKWNGSAWSALAGGMDNNVSALAFGPDGRLYAGGSFTVAGGVTVNYVAVWNGAGWQPLGTGVNAAVKSLAFDASGMLWIGGAFTRANGLLVTGQGIVRWNGATFITADLLTPGAPVVYSIFPTLDGGVYIGFDTSGGAVPAGVTTVTNDSPGISWPTIVINGPTSGSSRIYQLINYTTGQAVYFNWTILAGETATIVTDPQRPSFTSSIFGDLSSTILPGSTLALFYLAPGDNTISFLAFDATVTQTIAWQKRYNGMADLVH